MPTSVPADDLSPAALDAAELALRGEYTRFVTGLARVEPLHVRVSLDPNSSAYCVDTGVWARRCFPGDAAPAGAAPLNAVLFATSKFPTPHLHVAGDEVTARVLFCALELVDTLELTDDREELRELVPVAGLPVSRAALLALKKLLGYTRVTAEFDPSVAYDAPVGHLCARMRYGARSEGAYHEFCRTHGYRLISVDGAHLGGATHDLVDDRIEAWAWAWFDTPHRWAAGGELGGSSRLAEFTAAAEALRAHPGERIAVTYDYVGVGRVATAAAGLWTGGTSDVDLSGSAGELFELIRSRRPGAEVVWLPLSAKSSSRRHQLVDRLARSARINICAGESGPWGPDSPMPQNGVNAGFDPAMWD